MVSDDLFDRQEIGFNQWATTPDPEEVAPDSLRKEKERNDFLSSIRSDVGAIVLTHIDADGLGAGALISELEGQTIVLPLEYNGPYQIQDAVQDIQDRIPSTKKIIITDLGCDSKELAESVAGLPHETLWYDHHQWDDEHKEILETGGTKLVIDEDECATSLIAKWHEELPEHLKELAEVTKDIDLWIKEDPRSERLGAMARALDDQDYIENVLENGVKHNEVVEEKIDEYLDRVERLEDFAVDKARTTAAGGYSVAFTYVSGARTSTIGNRLVEEGGHDIAVVQTPTSCSIYSHSDRETFAECHKVAGALGGGGHPTASGFPVPVDTFREMAEYWSTAGRSVHGVIRTTVSQAETIGEE